MDFDKTVIYPMLFEPNLHSVVWGGSRLTQWKGMDVVPGIGESWEVSAVPGNAVAKEYDNKLRAAPACLRLSLTTRTGVLATR